MRKKMLGVAIGGVAAMGLLAGCGTNTGGVADPAVGSQVRVQYTMTPQPEDGRQVTAAELAESARLVEAGATNAGIDGLRAEVVDGQILVTAPGADRDRAYALGESARLELRPVLDTRQAAAPSPGAARGDRQSVDPMVQDELLATFDCDLPEGQRGSEDPGLPLMACDVEADNVYLLGPAIIGGAQVADARGLHDEQRDQSIVELEFTPEASETWAQFTAESVGSQAAFVLDSEVISAPVIQGMTPAGAATSITGQFTLEEGQALAGQLSAAKLPVVFTRSEMIEIPAG